MLHARRGSRIARAMLYALCLVTAGAAGGAMIAASAPPPPAPNPKRGGSADVVAATVAAGTLPDVRPPAGEPPAAARVPTAAWGETGNAEWVFKKRMDELLAPLAELVVAAEDLEALKGAQAALSRQDPLAAAALAGGMKEATARKLVQWMTLRAGYGEAGAYRTFLAANPDWPDRRLLLQRMEEALFTSGGDPKAIIAAFGQAEPLTGAGLAALASAHLALSDEGKARELAARAWRMNGIAASLESGFLERFGKLLAEADHRERLDRLLLDEKRWSGERTEQGSRIARQIALLSKAEQDKAEARLAVYLRSKQAGKLLAALPDTAPGGTVDWGLAYQRAQHLRRTGNLDAAYKVVLGAPTDKARLVDPDAWWEERHQLALTALKADKPKVAYDLVKEAGELSENPRKEQAFLAGWIALRKLANARTALGHFEVMARAADGPLSRSQAHYWLGRTHEALGDKAAAAASYGAAAGSIDTFHGQLAMTRQGGSRPVLSLPDLEVPGEPAAEKFNAAETSRALVLAHAASLDGALTRAFQYHQARTLGTAPELAMAAHLAEMLGDTQMAIRISKIAVARGFPLHVYAYPVHPLPDYKPLRPPPETALLLGLARQESEFATTIVSGAGARGILQVMPITARHVCKDYKIKCDIGRLTRDTAYNTALASAYVADRMEEVGGSYILGLTSYNAGPGRTRQWLRQFDDPRRAEIDQLDWIYKIPFEETREYVQKVLSNVQVYRARLGGGTAPLRIAEDLERARRP